MQPLKRSDSTPAEMFEPKAAEESQASRNLGVANGSQSEVPSPALALQQRLLDQLNAEEFDDGERWSPRATLLFCSAASLVLWGAIALGVAAFR
ncbi:MAG TPA: hypothetical protein VHY34_01885 [Caulobacteraceae bacterium]|nr:hypothetical protein [Caulobacteraceae bacterium]